MKALQQLFGMGAAPALAAGGGLAVAPGVDVAQRQRAMRQAFGLAMLVAVLVSPMMVEAFTAPAAGSLGYDIYNVVVNQLLSGPIGFVGAIILIVWGATQVMKQWLITVLCVICGTIIIKCQTIVTSLGALVPVVHLAHHTTRAVIGLH